MIRRFILLGLALAPASAFAADCQSMWVKLSPFGMAWEPRGFARCDVSVFRLQVCTDELSIELRGDGDSTAAVGPLWQGFGPGGWRARLGGRDMLVVARRLGTDVPVLVVRIFDERTRCEYPAMPERAAHP